jgi:hypothetical protein
MLKTSSILLVVVKGGAATRASRSAIKELKLCQRKNTKNTT